MYRDGNSVVTFTQNNHETTEQVAIGHFLFSEHALGSAANETDFIGSSAKFQASQLATSQLTMSELGKDKGS